MIPAVAVFFIVGFVLLVVAAGLKAIENDSDGAKGVRIIAGFFFLVGIIISVATL